MVDVNMGFKVVAVQVGGGEYGTDVVTLEDEHGQLTRELSKNVSRELMGQFTGKVFNNRDANN